MVVRRHEGRLLPLQASGQLGPAFRLQRVLQCGVLGFKANKYKEGGIYLGVVTMPMGYLNAMGLVQHLHRRLLPRGPQRPDGLLRSRETRKDRPVPALRPDSPLRELWQV